MTTQTQPTPISTVPAPDKYRIMVARESTPGHACAILAEYLKDLGHRVETVSIDTMKKSELANEIADFYDIAIAPNQSIARYFIDLRDHGVFGKVIYWRMAWKPNSGLLNALYQRQEREALQKSDVVWSQARPSHADVNLSLKDCTTSIVHVPYLLPNIPDTNIERLEKAIWSGKDIDGGVSLYLARACTIAANLNWEVADHSKQNTRRSDDELDKQMGSSKVGLAIYRPDSKKRSQSYYSDPARIKWSLAYGLPVVTTKVTPIYEEVEAHGAGFAVQYGPEYITAAIRECVNNFEEMSANAVELARKYVISDQWIKL